MLRFFLATTLTALAVEPLWAQHDHGRPGQPLSHVDKLDRDIRALSSDEIAALLAGEGMGLALSAELNDYPGPTHVLELAHDLGLSHDVVARIETVRATMLAAAVALGQRIVYAEWRLDHRFRSRSVNASTLEEALAEIADLQGQLRFVHLKAHVIVTSLLTPGQIVEYARLRGYSKTPS